MYLSTSGLRYMPEIGTETISWQILISHTKRPRMDVNYSTCIGFLKGAIIDISNLRNRRCLLMTLFVLVNFWVYKL